MNRAITGKAGHRVCADVLLTWHAGSFADQVTYVIYRQVLAECRLSLRPRTTEVVPLQRVGESISLEQSRAVGVVDQYGCFAGEHIVGLVRVSLCIEGCRWPVAVTCGYSIAKQIGAGRGGGVDSNGDSNVSARSL